MKKYLLNIFLFTMILFFTPQAFALDYNVSSIVTSPVAPSGSGTYTGEEQNGSTSSWNINTRYQGTLQRIRYNIPLPSNWVDGDCFAINNTYTITMEMATNDWRNRFGTVRVVPYSSYSGNWSNGRVTFVSRKKIYFSFTIPSSETTCYQSVYVDLPSNATFTPFTGDTNWNLTKITLTDPMYNSGGSGSGSGSTSSNQDIIDGANQNTQDIINNQSENTNNIIENNNSNTDRIIEAFDSSFNSCSPNSSVNLYDKNNITTNSYLNSSGTVLSNAQWFVTNYIPVIPGQTYIIDGTTVTGGSNISLVFYNSNKQYVSSVLHNDYVPPKQVRIPDGVYFVRDSVYINNLNTYSFKKLECKNKLDETNDYLQDDSDPNISDSEFTDLFNTVGFTDPLGYLLQLPIQFINQLVSQSNSCQTISLGTLWGVAITMPCIDIGSIIGQRVWDIIDVLFSVGLLVVIFKNLYQTFANLMTMGGEKEAREKFSMPTPMEFLSMILGGDR